jgi:hypothetical protein
MNSINAKVQQLQEQKEALDARIVKLEELESKTAPVKNLLASLLVDYATEASEELPMIWEEILAIGQQHGLSVQPLAVDELQQWEVANAEVERLRKEDQETKRQYLELLEASANQVKEFEQKAEKWRAAATISELAVNDLRSQLAQIGLSAQAKPEYEPDEAYDTIESILKSTGFQHPEQFFTFWDAKEKYESYRGWDVYFSVPNGGIVAIGLHDITQPEFQAWDASTEVIQEVDPTFPESLADFDEIVKWTRNLIDQVEDLEAFGQLVLEFPTTDEQIQEELGCNWEDDEEEVAPEQTELQKLLAGNSDFVFGELHARVTVASVFVEEEIESDNTEDDSDDPATTQHEQALFTVMDFIGNQKEYFYDAEALVHKCSHSGNTVKSEAEKFLERFKTNQQPETEAETEFEAMGYTVKVYPQLPMGVTFRFLNPDNTLAFSNSLISGEIGDRTWKVCAWDLIQSYRDKEAARIDKEQNPYKKPEDDFVELVKISNAVGYLKWRDNGQLMAGYAAFSNKLPDGNRATTQAKSRAQKWAEWLKGTFELECDAPRIAKRIISENNKQPFAYEVKIKGVSIGQLTKLAEEDFSLLPGEVEKQQMNIKLLRSETKAPPVPPGEIEQAAEPSNDGLTDEQYFKAVDEELALTPECRLNEDEIELVEMAQAAILTCDSEMVKNVNSVFKEVCEKNAANRVKVWTALTENEQQIYKLLLQMEFAKAPDFAEQTPEYIVYSDGKMTANVWMSLRTIDGVPSRAWRYTNQGNEIGYKSKEAAAIAAIQQQAG